MEGRRELTMLPYHISPSLLKRGQCQISVSRSTRTVGPWLRPWLSSYNQLGWNVRCRSDIQGRLSNTTFHTDLLDRWRHCLDVCEPDGDDGVRLSTQRPRATAVCPDDFRQLVWRTPRLLHDGLVHCRWVRVCLSVCLFVCACVCITVLIRVSHVYDTGTPNGKDM